MQRFTAVYIAGFVLFLVLRFGVSQGHLSYQAWRAWLGEPFVNFAAGLFVLSVMGHAWVGVRDVIMDYVRPSGVRVAALAVAALALLACAVWGLQVLVSVTVHG